MTQADSVHSTPPTNTPISQNDAPSRRRFLSQAAGVAAGGTVLALAAVSATADAAAPTVALASSGTDPIFALIEEYRAAAKTAAAAASELSRREEMLLEQGLGTCPFISVLNPSGTPSQEPTTVYTHEYIDRLIPPERFSKRNAKAHASLDARREQRKTIMGDSEEVLYAAQDAETEAVDELVWTPPKTIAGVLALLELWPELRRSRVLDDDQTDAITISVADALRGIHQLPEAGATVIPVVQA
jgi:hypothetical protein